MKNIKTLAKGLAVAAILGASNVSAATFDANYKIYTGANAVKINYEGTSETTYTQQSNGSFSYNNYNYDYDLYSTSFGANTGTDVDSLMSGTDSLGNSGANLEKAYLEAVVGDTGVYQDFGLSGSLSVDEGDEFYSGGNYIKTVGTGISEFNLGDATVSGGYFLLKFNQNAAYTHFIFKHEQPLNVLSWLTEIATNSVEHATKLVGLSHIGLSSVPAPLECLEIDPECGDVDIEDIPDAPIPAAIWLFGSALLGLTRFRAQKVSL